MVFNADINTKTIAATPTVSLPRVNVYFEDKEAADFFAALMSRQSVKKFTAPMPEVTLGCSNYLDLIKHKVPEFSERSVICLDPDVAQRVEGKNFKTIVLFPGCLPPDQLIFEYLYNLAADHAFWRNDLQFTRDVFTNSAREIISEFAISGSTVDVKEQLAIYQGEKKKPRDIFKRFYKDIEFQRLVTSGIKPYNPWKHWVENNPEASNEFLRKFETAIRYVMKNSYAVDATKLAVLEVKLKRG